MIEELLERNIGIAKYFSHIVIKSPFHQDALCRRSPFFPVLITGWWHVHETRREDLFATYQMAYG